MKSIYDRLVIADQERGQLRDYLKGEITTVDKFARDFQAEIITYRESLLYVKTVADNCMTEEDALS